MYEVYDEWGEKEFIGTADNMREVRDLARKIYNDTDGECQIWYYRKGEKNSGYFLDKF